MAERARHRDALARELGHAERGIAVHLLDDLFQITEGELPDFVAQRAGRLAVEDFVALMHRLKRVTHAALSKELRLAEVRIPAGAAYPAAHHVAAARHPVDVVRGRAGENAKDFVAHRLRAALVGVQAEDPVVFAGLDGTVAQFAEAVERHFHRARAERGGDCGGAVDAERVDHHHLVGPQHAGNGGGDFFRLVIGQDIG